MCFHISNLVTNNFISIFFNRLDISHLLTFLCYLLINSFFLMVNLPLEVFILNRFLNNNHINITTFFSIIINLILLLFLQIVYNFLFIHFYFMNFHLVNFYFINLYFVNFYFIHFYHNFIVLFLFLIFYCFLRLELFNMNHFCLRKL